MGTGSIYSSKFIPLFRSEYDENYIFGCRYFYIYGVRLLSYRFDMSEQIRNSILVAAIFMVLYFALRSALLI